MRVTVHKALNIRLYEAHVNAPKAGVLDPGTQVHISHTMKGQSIEGNDIWCVLEDNSIVWSGGLAINRDELPTVQKKYLLATADDYGVYDEIDEGIEYALKEEWINSVAVLVNKNNLNDFGRLKRLKSFLDDHHLTDKVHIGLHFTFASGKPLLNTHQCIVNSKGFFRSPFLLDDRHYDQAACLAEVQAELTAQLDKFSYIFGKPDHFTSHFDTHTFSEKLFLSTLDKIGDIPVRNYCFIPKSKRVLLDIVNTADFPSIRQLDACLLAKKAKKVSDQTIVSHYGPPGFIPIWNYGRHIRKKRETVNKHLKTFYTSKRDTVEIVYHLIKYDKLSQKRFKKIFKAQNKAYPHLNADYFDGRVAEYYSLLEGRPWEAFSDLTFLPKP